MTTFLIVLVSVIGALVYLVLARMTYGHIAWRSAEKGNRVRPNESDETDGFFAGLGWPLTLLVVSIGWLLSRAPKVGAEARNVIPPDKQRTLRGKLGSK